MSLSGCLTKTRLDHVINHELNAEHRCTIRIYWAQENALSPGRNAGSGIKSCRFMVVVKKRQCIINFQPGHVVHLQQGERDDELEHGDEDDVRGAGVQPPGEDAGGGGRRQLCSTQGGGRQWLCGV